MLFEELNKLKISSIMSFIIMMAIGIVLIIWPEEYTTMLIDFLGAVLLIVAVVMILDFMNSKKSLVDFVFLTLALIVGIAGMFTMIFDTDSLKVLRVFFGIILVISGFHGILHALIFARRSGRKGWWILMPFNVVLVALGFVVWLLPRWDTNASLMNVIGLIMIYSSALSALGLIWDWPIRSK